METVGCFAFCSKLVVNVKSIHFELSKDVDPLISATYSHYINMALKFGSVFYVLLIDFNPDQIHIKMNANNATCAYWPNFHTLTVI